MPSIYVVRYELSCSFGFTRALRAQIPIQIVRLPKATLYAGCGPHNLNYVTAKRCPPNLATGLQQDGWFQRRMTSAATRHMTLE